MRNKPIKVEATNIQTGETFVYNSVNAAGDKGGFSRDMVFRCIRGRSRTHAGFTFKALSPMPELKKDTLIHRVAAFRNKGFTNKLIAELLGLKESTVRATASYAITAGLCKTRAKTQEVAG